MKGCFITTAISAVLGVVALFVAGYLNSVTPAGHDILDDIQIVIANMSLVLFGVAAITLVIGIILKFVNR